MNLKSAVRSKLILSSNIFYINERKGGCVKFFDFLVVGTPYKRVLYLLLTVFFRLTSNA